MSYNWNNTIAAKVPSAGINPALQALQTNNLQAGTDALNQKKQNQIAQNEFTANDLTAQHYALDQSVGMQGNMNIPRTVTDTSMKIGGELDPYATHDYSAQSASGSRQLPADIQGHFMPLIQLGQLNESGGNLPPNVTRQQADFTPGDATAFQDAAFANTKAKAGQMGRSAVSSLAAELAGRGIGNSGTFARGVADKLVDATQPLNDLNVAHLGQEYNAAQHARELSEKGVSDIYAGDIQQRGQTIQGQQAINALRAQLLATQYQGQISQRGQDMSLLRSL